MPLGLSRPSLSFIKLCAVGFSNAMLRSYGDAFEGVVNYKKAICKSKALVARQTIQTSKMQYKIQKGNAKYN